MQTIIIDEPIDVDEAVEILLSAMRSSPAARKRALEQLAQRIAAARSLIFSAHVCHLPEPQPIPVRYRRFYQTVEQFLEAQFV